MSGNQPTKPFTDDAVEESTIDSGFLSGGDLMYSGEIKQDNRQTTLSFSQQKQSKHQQKQEVNIEDEFMRLDSGVDLGLSESFNNLSLKNPLENDFSKCEPKISTTPSKIHTTTTTTTTTTSPVDSGCTKSNEDLWKICFEQDEDGDTHLHLAIANRDPAIAYALIRIAPHPLLLDTPNDDAQTPIHLAVSTGQPQIVRWLIVAGAKPSPRNRFGDSPLHIASRNGDIECIKAILYPVQKQERQILELSYQHPPYYQPNLDQWNYKGQTCVHVAAIYGHVDILRYVLSFGADINAREGLSGYTALHYAIEKHDEKLQHFLLTECCQKLNVKTLTYGGKSALHFCPTQSYIYGKLKSMGAPSPSSSEDEDDEFDSDSDSDYEMGFKEQPGVSSLVNASA